METVGKSHVTSRGRLISLAIVLLALAIALYTLHESTVRPTSNDSSIDADVVHVASEVGGRVIEIPVSENSRVSEGDLLFQIDPVPYQLAVAQAEADLKPRRSATRYAPALCFHPAFNGGDSRTNDEDRSGKSRPIRTHA